MRSAERVFIRPIPGLPVLRLMATETSKRAAGLLETLRCKLMVSARTVDRFASSRAGGRTGGASEKWAGVWGHGASSVRDVARVEGMSSIVTGKFCVVRGTRKGPNVLAPLPTLTAVLVASSTNRSPGGRPGVRWMRR